MGIITQKLLQSPTKNTTLICTPETLSIFITKLKPFLLEGNLGISRLSLWTWLQLKNHF